MEDNSKENVDQGFSAVSVAEAVGSGGGGGGGGGGVGGNGGCAREDDEVLKRRISCHPLYGLLTETHLDCLKASMGDIEGLPRNSQNQANNKINTSMPSCSELDHFMEMYCMALSELKEAIEEPVQETTAFIDAMYFQLMELTGMGTHPPHTPPTSPGDESSRTHHQESNFVHELGGSTGEHINNSRMPSGTILDAYMSNGKREE